jgi:hypothetical protein
MDNVEVTRDECDGLVRAAGSANLQAHSVSVRGIDQLVQEIPLHPICVSSSPRALMSDRTHSPTHPEIEAGILTRSSFRDHWKGWIISPGKGSFGFHLRGGVARHGFPEYLPLADANNLSMTLAASLPGMNGNTE